MLQIRMYMAPHPKLRTKSLALAGGFFCLGMFLMKSHLGSTDWADMCGGLCILKLLHIMSSWFRENVIQSLQSITNRQGLQYHLCYKLGSFINTLMTQMCSLKCGPILVEWQVLLFLFFSCH